MAPLLPLLALLAPLAAGAVDLPWDLPAVEVGDRDADGHPEAAAHALLFGQCGCMCPVAGAEVAAEAAGQRVQAGAATALVVCGVLVDADADPGDLDPEAPPSARARPIVRNA